jgi:hypothetical protein
MGSIQFYMRGVRAGSCEDEWSDVKWREKYLCVGEAMDLCDREVLPRIETQGVSGCHLSRGLQLTARHRSLRKRGEGHGPIERELTLAQGGGNFSCLVRFSI